MIADEFDVAPDFPFDDKKYKPYGVFRHKDSGKWFGLIMNLSRKSIVPSASDKDVVDVINLKRDFSLVEPYPAGVYPAYHMNHKLWISVTLDDTLTDDVVFSLVSASFTATDRAAKRAKNTDKT